MDINEVTKLQADRLRYLEAAYHASNGDPSTFIDWRKIGTDLGFDERYTIALMNWLKNEYYIKPKTFGSIQITNSGMRIIEDAIKNPQKPAGSFVVSYNSIHIGQMINSSIQQGTLSSTQIIIHKNEIEKITELIKKIENSLSNLKLTQEQEENLQANLDTIKSQNKAAKPKRNIIIDSLNSIKEIFNSMSSTSALAKELLTNVDQILQFIGVK